MKMQRMMVTETRDITCKKGEKDEFTMHKVTVREEGQRDVCRTSMSFPLTKEDNHHAGNLVGKVLELDVWEIGAYVPVNKKTQAAEMSGMRIEIRAKILSVHDMALPKPPALKQAA